MSVVVAPPAAGAAIHPKLFVPEAVSFVSSTTGFAWGHVSRGGVNVAVVGSLAETTDYGRTWRQLPAPAGGWRDDYRSGLVGVTFVTPAIGYVFGDTLWATEDGGRHWVRRHTPDTIDSVTAGAGVAWALLDSCHSPGDCDREHEWLDRLTDDGRHFVPAGTPRLPDTATVDDVMGPNVIVDGGKDGPGELHIRSAAGTWRSVRSPCGYIGHEAFLSSRSIAMVCGSEPAMDEQAIGEWRSDDGGLRWRRVGRPGYDSLVSALAVDYPSTWVVATLGGVQVSQDGGVSWHDVTLRQAWDPGLAVAAAGDVGFTTAVQAVAFSGSQYSPRLALSTDGARHWTLQKIVLSG